MSRLAGHSDVQSVRDATDLVRLVSEHVALRPKGREHVGLCPFHDDKNPSFAVVTHKGNAFYKCHACGAGGDAFDFVMNYHRMSFGEALHHLAQRAGITLAPRQSDYDGRCAQASRATDLKKANAFAATFFQRTLRDETTGAAARTVIAARGISDEMVQAFGLGAAPDQWDGLRNRVRRQGLPEDVFRAAGLLKPRKEGDGLYDAFRNRVIFPICDELGNPIAFGARRIDPQDEPKYLNSAESPLFAKAKTLYGLHRAKRAIIDSRCAIITEGYTDVIACHQAGITNVVAMLGTALTREHAQALSRMCDRITLLFDGDEAGQKAGGRGFETLAAHFGLAAFFHEKIDVNVCVLPDDLDPDELLKQPGGRERFEQLLAGSRDVLEFILDRFRAQLDAAGGMSSRQKLAEGFLAQLGELGLGKVQGVRRSLILNRLSELLGVPAAQLDASIPKPRSLSPPAVVSSPASGADRAEPVEHAAGEHTAGGMPSSLRMQAERHLLSILIHELAAGELPQAALPLLSEDDFVDPAARPIAEEALAFAQRGEALKVQDLLVRLDDPRQRELATSLFFEGERHCSASPAEAVAALAAAVEALHACIRREQFQRTVSSRSQPQGKSDQLDPAALQDLLRLRKQAGHLPAALAQGLRR